MNSRMIPVGADNGVVFQGNLWFLVRQLNILCCLDIEKMSVIRTSIIPFDWAVMRNSYVRILTYKNRLLLIPEVVNGSNKIVEYIPEVDQYREIDMFDSFAPKNDCVFDDASVVGNKMYCFSVTGPYVYVYDLESNKGEIINEFAFDLITEGYVGNGSCVDMDGNIHVAIYGKDSIVTYLPECNHVEELSIGSESVHQYPVVEALGDYLFWFSNRGKGCLYAYDRIDKETSKVMDIGFDHTYLFSVCEKYLVCDSGVDNKYIIFDQELNRLFESEKGSCMIGAWFTADSRRFLHVDSFSKRIELFEGLSIIASSLLEIPSDVILASSKYIKDLNMIENEVVGLEFFINAIS